MSDYNTHQEIGDLITMSSTCRRASPEDCKVVFA